jgi:hypothetical protein
MGTLPFDIRAHSANPRLRGREIGKVVGSPTGSAFVISQVNTRLDLQVAGRSIDGSAEMKWMVGKTIL